MFDFADLLRCLELEALEGSFEGRNLELEGYHRVFGGQIVAQLVTAAALTSPGKSVKSLTVVFAREGATSKPMRYAANPLQDGRTFGTTELTATQDGKLVAAALASLHVDEDGLRRSDSPPTVGAPQDAAALDLPMIPWEARVVDGVDLNDPAAAPASLRFWLRAPAVGDARALHQALLAHASELTLIGTSLRPFAGVSQRDAGSTLQTAATSHSLWFHQPFRVDEWLLLVQHSPVVAGGRGFARGEVFTQAGELVASYAQESLIRSIAA